MPTHAHGQGYTDVNFVIPELVESIDYRKGTYYAETGNFSAAGAVNMRYRSALDAPFVALEDGDDDYMRGLFARRLNRRRAICWWASSTRRTTAHGSRRAVPQDQRAACAIRTTPQTVPFRLSLLKATTASGDRPTRSRCVRAIGRDRSLRSSSTRLDGGDSHRYSLAADWYQQLDTGAMHAMAYAIDYQLDLFSNFTYATDTKTAISSSSSTIRRVYGGSSNGIGR
jgi:hypothetical protein